MNTIPCLFTTLLATTAAAQMPGPGLTWTGASGGGSFLPSCTSIAVTAAAGDSVALNVWGDPGAPFLLFGGASATQCLPIPGVGNGLVLDFPIALLASGTLTQLTPCLACPPGYQALPFVVPALPPGVSASFQAASFGNNVLALTVAITATVQ